MPPTAYLQNTEYDHVIRMVWEQDINEADVLPMFNALTRRLNMAPRPMIVVVDLSRKPKMPLTETITGAMSGAFGHPNLEYWVMIGSTRAARMVENVLTKVLRFRNTVWFNTEEEAFAFIRQLEEKREVA